MSSSFDILEQQSDPAKKITVALERLSEAFRVLLWQESRKNGLSPIQIQILVFLLFHSADKCKVGYLASEFNMTKATVSDSIKVLFQKGLIEKITDGTDTRSFSILLTESGKLVAGEASLFTKPIENAVADLPAYTQDTLLVSLMSMIDKLNVSQVITVQRMCKTCRFFDIRGEQFFCKLLNKSLETRDLRVDCPEHELAG